MNSRIVVLWRRVVAAAVGSLWVLASSCSDSGSGTPGSNDAFVPAPFRTIIGTLEVEDAGGGGAAQPPVGYRGRLDDAIAGVPVGDSGEFHLGGVPDGDHSIFFDIPGMEPVEVPCRILSGRGIDLGRVRVANGRLEEVTGFDGYRFGFIDGDGDGVHDDFADANGDGVCDSGMLYAGYAYLMDHGYVDANRDGTNDRYQDADGDGIDDLGRGPLGNGFGWKDDDADGVNDWFQDADGDGLCDVTGMPYGHPFGHADQDGDGINDRFVDADGDGVNELTGARYIAMPGWVDLDGDGRNDFFRDADGNGVNDLMPATGMPYGLGFGWRDDNRDGINDRFWDADGDGVNDNGVGGFAAMTYGHGFSGNHVDANGDGIDDESGSAYAHGMGWVDADLDGKNDAFADANGDGTNDLTGHRYPDGYGHAAGSGMHGHAALSWPFEPPQDDGGGMMGGR